MNKTSAQYSQIYITGALGWLGSNLVRALVGQNSILKPLADKFGEVPLHCFDQKGADFTPLKNLGTRVHVHEGDLRDVESCKKFLKNAEGALVIHTAGVIHPKKVADFYSVNLRGTQHILEAAEQEKAARAVIVSSNSPCGTNPHPEDRFTENSPYRPYMHYGRSKKMMEEWVNQFSKKSNLETVLIRSPWFYGTHQPARQTLFFSMIKNGKAPVVGSGNNARSMCFIDNLIQGLLLAALVPEAVGQTFWIADEKPYRMNEIIDTIETVLEKDFSLKCAHKRMRLPSIFSEVAYLVDKALQSVGLYHQKIHVLSEMNKTIACSVEKAKKELGYKPYVSLEEGMRQSIRWCLNNGMSI